MNVVKHAAIAALLSCSLLTPVTPAQANPPIFDTTGLTPQQVCDAQLKPDEKSDFVTYPGTVTIGTPVPTGSPIRGTSAGPASGYGPPTYSNIFLTSGFYRNGGSPNVWGGATATTTWGQTQQLFHFSQATTRTDTFDCVVSKVVGSGSTIEPSGLQSTGNTVVVTGSIPLPDQNVITEDDFITYGDVVNALICISPNNVTKGKPGTWTGKNGFLASGCDAASAAAGGTVPSNNAPFI